MVDDKNQRSLEFLNPEVTRSRLIAASVFIASYESLTDAIVSRVRSLYWRGFDQSGELIEPSYKSEILSRNRSPLYASFDWLRENGAIADADLAAFERAKACRNKLAHELFATVADDGLPSEFETRFTEMLELLRKVEVWWVVNFELPADDEYAGREIDESTIVPGRIIGLQVLMDVAMGDQERSWYYFREMQRRGGAG